MDQVMTDCTTKIMDYIVSGTVINETTMFNLIKDCPVAFTTFTEPEIPIIKINYKMMTYLRSTVSSHKSSDLYELIISNNLADTSVVPDYKTFVTRYVTLKNETLFDNLRNKLLGYWIDEENADLQTIKAELGISDLKDTVQCKFIW